LFLCAAALAAPAEAASPASGPPGSTARAEGAEWALVVTLPPAWTAAQVAHAHVRIEAKAGYHVNADYPLAFAPAEGPGDRTAADFASHRVPLAPGKQEACAGPGQDSCAVEVLLPFTPRAGDELRLAGKVLFSVCSKDRCLIEKAPVELRAKR
jgi:hypothetical protein